MKNLLFSFFAILLYCNSTLAQCPQGNIMLTSQQEVDDFASTYPGCTEILGSLRISDDPDTPIDNLNGLAGITSILGDFDIVDNNLTSLTGLESLSSVGEYLWIKGNHNLAALTGLENLSFIGNILYIENNSNLTSLTGLENINNMEGALYVIDNDNLITLMGLENLSSIERELFIRYNDNLTTLGGLENLNSIGGGISLLDNPNLTTLAALENLTSIGGILSINDNDNLTTLSALENLTSIGGSLSITGNANLATLSALENITAVGGSLGIGNNDALIDLSGLENITTVGENIGINGNDNLTTLLALENITTFGGNLEIIDNDNLSTLMPLENISSVVGILEISGNDNLTDLIGLHNITSVGLSLIIDDNLNLTTLTDLENLNSVGGAILISNHPNLGNLAGLESIMYIGLGLLIDNNDNLTNLAELENIVFVGGLNIINNDNLVDLTGLENLSFVEGILEIKNNANLTTLAALGNISSDLRGLDIINNPSLTNLTGLEGISLTKNLRICDNDNLANLTGLANLNTIQDILEVKNNDGLTSLATLENLTSIGGYLLIEENQQLAACSIDPICYYLANAVGNSFIYNNATGCNNQLQVENICNNTPTCGLATTSDSLTHIFDEDLFIDGVGFANNPMVTFTDPGTPADAVLSDISLELYFRLNGSSCENEIAIQIIDPAGNNQPLTAYTTCDGGTGLYYVSLNVPSGNTTGSIADWTVQFDDTNDQNSDYEYSVRFARLNYIATTTSGSGTTIVNEVSDDADMDLFIDGVGFSNNPSVTFTDPGTPADAVLSDISLELYFRLNGSSCENEIAIQIIDPTGYTQSLTAYTTCDGGTGLYYANLDVPSGNTTGSPADWTVQFDDTNDQNADYEYSVRFGRLTYTTTNTEGGGGIPVTVNESVSDIVDADLFIDGVGFENNGTYTFSDPGTPADAVLSDISLELYFRLNGNSCENEIALQITDPAGNTQPLTAYTTCDGGTGLFYVNLDVPSGNTTGNVADWLVEFDDTNDQNTDYEYSVRFGRLTYNTEYTECVPMLVNDEENTPTHQHLNASARQHVNTSTRQHVNTSIKLYPVPASQYLNVEYFSENVNSTNIEILSNEGKTLMSQEEYSQEGMNTLQLDIAHLPAGHYHIRMYNADDMQIQSFVKIMP